MNLKQYSAMAAAFFAVENSDAQIVYTDIPDTTISNNFLWNFYNLDLNNDGVVDYTLVLHKEIGGVADYHFESYAFSAYNSLGNQQEGSINKGFALSLNDTIDESKPWTGGSVLLAYHKFVSSVYYSSTTNTFNVASGQWIEALNKFLGVRFILNSDTLYGWIRMDVDLFQHVIVKDYAYNSVPEAGIVTGDTGALLNINVPASEAEVRVFPNPTAFTLHVQLKEGNFQKTIASIADLSGKIMWSEEIFVPHSGIDVSQLPAGMYFLELRNKERSILKKFEVKR